MENAGLKLENGAIAENLANVKNLISKAAEKSGREQSEVRLVAVTKTVDIERIRTCMNFGQHIFGENYVQELLLKSSETGPGADWHFIGHLQTNKVKKTIEVVTLIHTLDRLDLAKEIDKRAASAGKIMDCLIEVNLGGESTKTGISKDDVSELMNSCKLFKNLRICGLMTIPPPGSPDETRPFFKQLRDLMNRLKQEMETGPHFHELSMGMSGDFEAAVEEGATIVRVGTAIFGERKR